METSQAISTDQTFTIAELHTLVRSGVLRIPQFQRSFRWDAADVQSLFDSALRGYPFGSLLLWQREAEADRGLRIGELRVDAEARVDALWVVDGQQRITSLVNAIDPAGANDPRFALGYELKEQKIVGAKSLEEEFVISLPELFGFSTALHWLVKHPEAHEYATHLQDIAGRLNRVTIPATIMKQADEQTLRDVFGRINSRGKRLNAAEIFDAIHGSSENGSMEKIIEHVHDATRFGLLEDKVAVQALLVRRHTDITRDVEGEFSKSRKRVSDFPDEERDAAYDGTERALITTIQLLQNRCGIPHLAFLPFRFQLLVLSRFFALFPEPQERNLELLTRWFWRTTTGADDLGISGSQRDLRDMASCIVRGEESRSVQRLLEAATLPHGVRVPRLDVFRTTRSDSKAILAALWNLHPVDPQTGKPLTTETLAEMLQSESTPRALVTELLPPSALKEGAPVAASKVISTLDRHDLLSTLDRNVDLPSLLLDEEMLNLLQQKRFPEFLSLRKEKLHTYLQDFLTVRTGVGHEDTPPLSEFIFDDSERSEAVAP
ncbi:MAG: DUF262 domain-containing protein [Pseudoclavibacter sp.]|nr:DUF262 domain-containing protein [Pseudoclavibacter sp.]